jgi:hypothetical protein
MVTAVTQLNQDFFGQSFEPYNTNPPLALEHLASSTDANNLTTGGTISSGSTITFAGAVLSGGTAVGLTQETPSGFVQGSFTNNIVATGSGGPTATLLTSQLNHITTCASGAGVALPYSLTVTGGGYVWARNDGVSACHFYGQSGDTVDGSAGTAGVLLGAAHACFYMPTSGGFITGPEGGASS